MPKRKLDRTTASDSKDLHRRESEIADHVSSNIERRNAQSGFMGNYSEDSLLNAIRHEIPPIISGQFIQAVIR